MQTFLRSIHTTTHMHQKWALAQEIKISGACPNNIGTDQLQCNHKV